MLVLNYYDDLKYKDTKPARGTKLNKKAIITLNMKVDTSKVSKALFMPGLKSPFCLTTYAVCFKTLVN